MQRAPTSEYSLLVVSSQRTELSTQLQPLRAEAAVHVSHRPLDDLAPITGGVADAPVARVDPHVAYGFVPTLLLEEDYVAGAKARLCDLAAAVVGALAIFAHGQLVPELAEDCLGQARAAHHLLGAAGEAVLGTDVSSRHPHDVAYRRPTDRGGLLPRGALPVTRGVLLARGAHPVARGGLLARGVLGS